MNLVKTMFSMTFLSLMFFGCSQSDSVTDSKSLSYTETELILAQQALQKSSKNLLANWFFVDSTSAGHDFSGNANHVTLTEGPISFKDSSAIFEGASGLSMPITAEFKQNNLALETCFWSEQLEGNNTLVALGANADGDGLMIRTENDKVVVLVRERALSKSWQAFTAGKVITAKSWHVVRVERADSLLAIYLDGSMVVAISADWDLSDLKGDLTIGFDAESKSSKCFFRGKIKYVRIETINKLKPIRPIDLVDVPTKYLKKDWLAAWEFNDPSNLGLDFSGNGHSALVGEGVLSEKNGSAVFDGASGLEVSLDSSLKIDEFTIEARVFPTAFGALDNILSAEPPGRFGSGWILRLEKGVLKFLARDLNWSTDWKEWSVDTLSLNQWYTIRVERSVDSLFVAVNNKVCLRSALNGNIGQTNYNWGIGYDAMNQAYHDRYFKGKMDFVRFGSLNAPAADTISANDTNKTDGVLIAAWEFNDSLNIGRDFTSNGFDALLAEGQVSIVKSALVLDGHSGLMVELKDSLSLNEFIIEARINPTTSAKIINIITAEPPGYKGSGWILRLENNTLVFLIRDKDLHSDWVYFNGPVLKLNEWSTVRVERFKNAVKIFINDELFLNEPSDGDISDLTYNWGIGYDAMNQKIHDRYFIGSMDYVRFYSM